MKSGKTMFTQLMDLMPWTGFGHIVTRYGGATMPEDSAQWIPSAAAPSSSSLCRYRSGPSSVSSTGMSSVADSSMALPGSTTVGYSTSTS